MKEHSKASKSESARKQAVETQANNRERQETTREIQRLAERLWRAARAGAGNGQPATAIVEDGFHVGIDLGDRESNYCFLDAKGNIVAEGALGTTQAELDGLFSSIPTCRIAIEVGTHSPWVSALLESHGHKVFVANLPRLQQ